MATSTPPDNTVLVLYPPIVNGRTEPIEGGADIGLPLVSYDLVTDGEGAVVSVDPPLSGNMDRGDVMELWLEDESAALDSETIVDPDVRTTLRIPKGRLHPDRVNKLYYTVRRGSSNIGTSPSLRILYNRIRPGLKDRLTNPGGHSELILLLPDIIKNGVGPDFVSAEVCVTYPYCRAYDLISFKCNGELLDTKPKVNPNQAPTPPNPGNEDPITICFTITRAFLDKAKRLDKKLYFSFSPTDQLGNGPDTDAPWSAVQSVDEDLDGVLLKEPILLERKEDYPGDDASIIDMAKLAGKPLLLVVLTTDNRFVVGYDVIATYTATNTGQPADVVVTVRGKVEADPFGAKLTLFLEVPNDKIFAGSRVRVTYELRKPNGDLVGSSKPAQAQVIGGSVPDEKPVITLFTGLPSGKEIPNGGTTEETAGTLTGTASKGLQIEVLDNQTESKGKATADGVGKWSHKVAGLQEGAHSLTAKALYGSGQVSVARTFTVEAAQADVRPAIVSVFGQNGEINNGAVIEDTSVVLSGTAKANQKIQIFENEQPKDEVNVDHNGDWVQPLANLDEGTHVLKARALYDTGLDSNIRFFIIKSPGSDLEFDERPASISAFRHIFSDHPDFEPVNPSPGSFLDRPAKNGKPPYQYKSDNTNVASVNKDGRIYAYRNGETEISVTDSTGTTKKLKLTTSGTFYEWKLIGPLNYFEAKSAASNAGGSLPSIDELQRLYQVYRSGPGIPALTWSSTPAHGTSDHGYIFDFRNGSNTHGFYYHRHSGYILINNQR